MPCDDCGAEFRCAGWTPEGHDPDGPVVCRDCYEERDGPAKARQRQFERRARDAVRTGRRYPDGEGRPLDEYLAHDAARQRGRVIDNQRA